MLKQTRRIMACVFLTGITLLFLDFTGTLQPWLGWMAKLQFLPSLMALNITALIVLLLTIAFGRIYCSAICPLGVLQDLVARMASWTIFRKNKKAKLANRYKYSKPKTWMRLTVLVLFVTMMVAGFNAGVVLLAPYSSYGRMVAAFLQPLYIGVNNILAVLAERHESYAFWHVEPHNNPMVLIITAAASFIVIAILAVRGGRTYCNTICPVGTVLGYVAKFSWLKIQVDEDKCVKCGLCAKNCKASCISVEKGKPVLFDYTRCVVCGNCETVCNKQAITYSPIRNAATPSCHTAPPKQQDDLSRRSFLTITGSTIAAAALKGQEKTTDGGLAAIEGKKIPVRQVPVTPPGSLSARHLQQHCTACQLCIANCPNGVLRPSQSLDRFMQPEMQYDSGYCRPECTRCSEVCPTGAIRPITKEAKQETQIGHAVWIKDNCLPANGGDKCGNCAKHCPVHAIQMVPMDKTLRQDPDNEWRWLDGEGNEVDRRDITMIPAVNTEKCIGCGTCEYLCPVRPLSAIYVEGHEIHHEA